MRRSPERSPLERAVLAAREAAAERTFPNGQHILLENIFLLDDRCDGRPRARMARARFLGRRPGSARSAASTRAARPMLQRRTLGEFGSLHER
jgi:hypothetical protein